VRSRRVQLWAAATVSVCVILAAATSAYLVLGRSAPPRPSSAGSSLPKVISLAEANQLLEAQRGGKADCAALETFQERVIYPCVETKGNARWFCQIPHLSYDGGDAPVACHPAGAVKRQAFPASQGL
jgi:hypothetical protein